MVNAKFFKKNSKIVSYKLEGHAESVEDGYDMVCSAISAISLAITNGVTEILHINPEINIKDGFLSMNLHNLNVQDIEKCQVLLETMLLAFNNLELSFGDYINVKVEEV